MIGVTLLSEKLLNFISSDNLNLVVSDKGNYMNVSIILSVLNEGAIKEKKSIYMYCIENNKTYYMSRLISLVTGIDIDTVHNYCNPCDCYNGLNKKILEFSEYDNYLNGMKMIIESDLMIAGYTDGLGEHIISRDPLDTILLESSNDLELKKIDIIIIDSLSKLIKYSKYDREEIIKRIKAYSLRYNVKFLIFDCWNHFVDSKGIDNIINVREDEKSGKINLSFS